MDDRIPGDHEYLGDVVIAVPLAEAQARDAGHDLLSELSLLSVHGLLHLLGHDHADESERKAMWRMQEEILAQLGIRARPTEI
jgi:probable rRNA maturation factor